MEDNKKLYTTPEAAIEIGISSDHLRNLISKGQAKPDQRIGNSWVFTFEEIERLRNRPKYKGGRGKKRPQE